MRTIQQPQHVEVHFSDPLDDNLDLNGLIYLKSGAEVTLTTEDNLVKIYPTSRQNGNDVVVIDDAIKNSIGYQLVEAASYQITFTSLKPKVELIGKGVILPTTNGLIFPFKAVSLKAVNVKVIKVFENNIAQFMQVNQFDGTREIKRVGRIVYKKEIKLTNDKPIDLGKWNTYTLDLSAMIETEPGAIYRVEIDFSKEQSIYPCTDGKNENNIAETASLEEENQAYDNPGEYYYNDDYYYEDYNWHEKDDPCKTSYYYSNQTRVARNVLVSNLGIIAKGGDNKQLFVAITDLRTTEPLSGVQVEIYNYQNQLLASTTSNAEGMATIELQHAPFLLVAKNGAERGYLRLDDGSANSLSMFDVGGDKVMKGIKGFLYGERGVWRPGDSLYLTFMLEDKNNALPENHPVVLELYTPTNQLYLREVRTASLNGFYNFSTKTDPESPTGNWLAKVK
ncbi:MAG: hypothetical protein HC896_09465 [Bacteroidales bacterium]|nr:hypothetical protein [Bacteroidales bacterium]